MSLATDLQAALQAMPPPVNDGDVIEREHYNTLHDAIRALAGLLDAGVGIPRVSVSMHPNFVASLNSNLPSWIVVDTGVSQPGAEGKTGALGWMSAQLPDGAHIRSMTVYGKQELPVDSLVIHLIRYKLDDDDQSPMSLIILSSPAGGNAAGMFPFGQSKEVKVPSTTPSALVIDTLEDYRRVQNDKYKYIIMARLVGAPAKANVVLHAIQVSCGPT